MIQNIEPEVPASRGDFSPIKKGMYQVQIMDISDKQRVPFKERANPDAQATENIYTFKFGILNPGEFHGRLIWRDVSAKAPIPSKPQPTATWEIVSAVLGKNLTAEEGASFGKKAFNDLIGRQLQIFLDVEEKNGKVRNKITLYTSIEKELPSLEIGDSNSTSENSEINVEDIPF